MQFSTLVSISLAAIANAAPAVDDDEATTTMTNYVTKVLSQHTTYVPMAITFLANVQNTTATVSNSTTASNSTSSNSTSTSSASSSKASGSASSSGDVANAAPAAGIAGLSVLVGAAALLL